MPATLLDDPPGPAALAELRRHGIVEPERAARELRSLAPDPASRTLLIRLIPELLAVLPDVPDPDAALSHLERFVRASGGGAAVLGVLQGRGRESLALLLFALGATPFLADALVRHHEWAGWLTDRHALAPPRQPRELAEEVRRALDEAGPGGARDALRRVKRRELVRLALRDLRRLAPVEETLATLSALADALVAGAYEVAAAEVRAEAGLDPARADTRSGFVVMALGKLGGSELNFSSDVDLVYVHRSDAGRVARPRTAPSRHAHAESLARRLTSVLDDPSHEGNVYRVDLRLRPEGRAGAISHSLQAAEAYYRARGAPWERLALIKARPVAGDETLARAFAKRLQPFVWRRPFDLPELAQVLRMKHEGERRLHARGLGERHVKVGRGGIREVELVAQVLQLRSGGARRLGARATLAALDALRARRILPAAAAQALARAYVFLRDVENKLQMVHDSQTHVLPAQAGELRLLARRLGYADTPAETAAARFASDYARQTDAVRGLFEELLLRPASA